MGRVPRRRVLASALAIVMANLPADAFRGAACPVAAGRRGGRAVEIAPGQDVVTVRRVAAAVADLTLFVQRVVLRQFVVVAMQIGDARCDLNALGVEPGPGTDAILRVHTGLAVGGGRAEIRGPDAIAGAGGFGQCRAKRIGSGESADIAPLTGARTGNKEAQRVALGIHG